MAGTLVDLSNSLAASVESAGASVVRVEGRRGTPASGILWSSDGVVVTASHVVRRDEGIEVGLPDGRALEAKLLGRDPTTDVSLLRVSSSGLSTARLADGDPSVGHLVLALGRPGQTVQATLGIVSALGDEWRTPEGGMIDRFLQTDVVMYPGFSGGPLISAEGKVLGMNTSGLLRGISLAVPVRTLRRVAEALIEHGHVRRAYLGIGAQPVRLPEGIGAALHQETGVLLMSVEPGGPADRSGLMLGDTMVSFGDKPIRHMDDLLGALGGDRIGEAVSTKVLRGGQLTEVRVTVGERRQAG